MLVAPLPRQDELPLPEPCPLRAGFLLHLTIGTLGIALEVEGPALAHHRRGDVAAADHADGDDALVSVAASWLTPDRAAFDQAAEGFCRAFAASPGLRRQAAGLGSLRRIDTPEPDALARELERVAVDDSSDPFEGRRG